VWGFYRLKNIIVNNCRRVKKNLVLIRELFVSTCHYRHLLKEFVGREIKGRFAGTFAGILWTVISPVATMLAYFFVFSVIVRMQVTVAEVGTDSFLFFFLAGFFPWLMFSEGLTKAVGSLVAQSGLITKVVFPVELLPLSALLSSFILNGAGFLMFLIYLAFSGYFHLSWFLLPVLVIVEALFALGLAWFLAALCVFVRDIAEILNIVIMLWFFGTPIIYPGSMVPEALRPLFYFNPMASYMQCFRNLLFFHQLDILVILKLFILALICCLSGAWFFMRSKPAFGDVL